MNEDARRLVDDLGLKPHPEGGFFRETYRSATITGAPEKPRAAMTSINYLLADGAFSAFHRIGSDEMWHHYRGAPVAIEIVAPDGSHRTETIGDGARWQAVVPAGSWFSAHVAEPGGYALVGCDVAPGFTFEEFELASRDALSREFPRHAALIERWTR